MMSIALIPYDRENLSEYNHSQITPQSGLSQWA